MATDRPNSSQNEFAATRRSIIEEAKLCYEAHWEQMLLAYPHLRMTPWDDQDAAVHEAWIEHITPETCDSEAVLAYDDLRPLR